MMHSCNQNEEVSAYIDDELSRSARLSFEAHMETCAVCRKQVEQARCLRTEMQRLAPRTVGYDLAPRVRARFLWRREASGQKRSWRFPLLVPFSSALAMTVVLGIYLGLVITKPADYMSWASELALLDPVPACSASISTVPVLVEKKP